MSTNHEAALLAVIETLRHKHAAGEFRGASLYERVSPVHPRRKPEWEQFPDLDEKSVRRILDRLEARGVLVRARRSDGLVRRDRMYLFPAAKQEAA